MIRVGLISDTHSHMDSQILGHLDSVDQIWHAGDIGDIAVLEQLQATKKPVIAVHGNIDHGDVKSKCPLNFREEIEGMDVFMTHIGGYPGRYNRRVTQVFSQNSPGLFICGHSHILKIMYDKKYNFLHINPGACGFHGFHHIRTMVRFSLENANISNMEVIELGLRSQ